MMGFKHLYALLVCILIINTTACGAIDPNTPLVSIPYRINNEGHYLVDVLVNNTAEFAFIVDTAAENTSVNLSALEQLGLKPVYNSWVMVQGANGRTRARIYKIDSIQLGAEMMQDFQIAAVPHNDGPDYIGGILGLDFLSRYTVMFDCQVERIKLYEKHAQFLLDKSISFQKIRSGIIMFSAQLMDQPVTAILDTGARRNVINWAAAKQIGVIPGDFRLQPDDPITGATGKRLSQLSVLPSAMIKIGTRVKSQQAVTVADLAVFNVLGMHKQSMAILGTPLLRQRSFVIDYQRSTLSFSPLATGQSSCKAG